MEEAERGTEMQSGGIKQFRTTAEKKQEAPQHGFPQSQAALQGGGGSVIMWGGEECTHVMNGRRRTAIWGGTHLSLALGHLTLDHALLSRGSTVPVPDRDTFNISALITSFSI